MFLKTVWRQEGGAWGQEQIRVLEVLRGSLSVCTALWDSWKCRLSTLKCHVLASRDGVHPATSRPCFPGWGPPCNVTSLLPGMGSTLQRHVLAFWDGVPFAPSL